PPFKERAINTSPFFVVCNIPRRVVKQSDIEMPFTTLYRLNV
ncbi:MAG: hypothetical protein ACI9N3_002725, partial [Colwellia sp.]